MTSYPEGLARCIADLAAAQARVDDAEAAIDESAAAPALSLLQARDSAVASRSRAMGSVAALTGPRVLLIACTMLRGQSRYLHVGAEDLAQDVQGKLMAACGTFNGETDVQAAAWVHQVAANACRDLLRKAKREPKFVEIGADTEPTPGGPPPPNGERPPDDKIDILRLKRRLPGLLELCKEQAVDLVQTKAPEDLLLLARKKSIGMSREAIEKNVQVWKLFKIGQFALGDVLAADEIATELGTLSATSVSRYADRGMWACETGRQRGLRPDYLPDEPDPQGYRLLQALNFLALKDDSKARRPA